VLLLTAPVWVPLWVVVALAVYFGSPGPVLFRQQRIGSRGSRFTCFKFRTMQVNARTDTHQSHVKDLIQSEAPMTKLDAGKDDRLVPGGNWIRVSGLDELPQIINILRGEMSIVGPRPCIPYEYALYEPWQRHRCDAAPGLTGLWQVSGKNRTTFNEMVQFDITYSQRMSLWLDAVIVLRTPLAILQQIRDLVVARRARKAASPTPSTPVGATVPAEKFTTQKCVL
jgi:lipopolysaccharide/colanic/teichoic acid biosynthesis glycosyltransferase